MLPYAVTQQTEENDIAKLTAIVKEAVGLIASETGLSSEETLEILETFSVDDIRSGAAKTAKSFEAKKFSKALNLGIKNIALATGLNTSGISTIFTEKKHALLPDIVFRLRQQSKYIRWNMSHY